MPKQDTLQQVRHSRLLFRPNVIKVLVAVAVGLIGVIMLQFSMAATNPNLPGDLNNDNKVNVTDMSILLSNFGKTTDTGDINSDGKVTVTDLSILLSNFNKTYSGNPTPTPPTPTPPTPTPPALPTPTDLIAFTGGNNIALRWTPGVSTSAGTQYNVIRDGTKIATITPGSDPLFPEVTGSGYIDNNVIKGTTYKYQVQAVNSSGTSALSATVSATHPTNSTPVPTVTYDASGAPDLENWLKTSAVPFIQTWYPKTSNLLAYPDYTPLTAIKLNFDPNLGEGTAFAYAYPTTGEVRLNALYLRNNKTPDIALLLHEVNHVVQGTTGSTPGWLVEGVADFYSRDLVLHQRPINEWKPAANSTNYYTDTYTSAPYFLNYIQSKYDSTYSRKVTQAGHANTFSASLFQFGTKNIDELWVELLGLPARTGPFKAASSNKCIDISNSGITDQAKVQLWDCNGSIAQKITAWKDADNTVALHVLGKCLDINNSGTADGTAVWLYGCSHSAAQKWKIGTNGTIINPNSGKCLTVSGGTATAANGTQMVISTCNGSAGQIWTVPTNTPLTQ